MIFYLTFNDAPSGIYSSQVLDVIRFARKELSANIRLIAFISIRGFSENKKKIRLALPDSIVMPMVPGVHRWKKNSFLLNWICMRFQPEKIIGRSVLATYLALKVKQNGHTRSVVYDGRGAIAAEWKEYGVVNNPRMLSEISAIEQLVINASDHRIAVSQALVKYWQSEYSYSGEKHVVIPCTLNRAFEEVRISEENISVARAKLNIPGEDMVFVYSGSLSGWQSFGLLYNFLLPLLKTNQDITVLFLSPKDENIARLEQEFPGKIKCKNVSPAEVPSYLLAADYGLLIREQSDTNKVASPVKFAEYLACGLKVLISENLGDYSRFVEENNCGYIYKNFKKTENISLAEKNRISNLAKENFRKENFKPGYREIMGIN